MCGIVGFVRGTKPGFVSSKNSFIEQGLIAGCFRGMDSTGVFSLEDKDGAVPRVFKKAMNPIDFVQLRGYDMVTDASKEILVVGHNRASTIGMTSDANAHPFQVGPITLVHNGTLTRAFDLPHKHPDLHVDSAHATACLAAVDNPIDALKIFEGAYMLVWYDERTPDVLYFARNDTRSFYFTFGGTYKELSKRKQKKTKTKDKFQPDGSMYFASERKMLDWLLDRNHISRVRMFYYPEPFKLYTIPLRDAQSFRTEKYEAEPIKSVWEQRMGNQGYGSWLPGGRHKRGDSSGLPKVGSDKRKTPEVITPTDFRKRKKETPALLTGPTGGPTSSKRINLEILGFKLYQQVETTPIGWESYDYTARQPKVVFGYGLFSMLNDNDPFVEIQGMTEAEFDYIDKLGTCFGKLVGTKRTPKKKDFPAFWSLLMRVDWDSQAAYAIKVDEQFRDASDEYQEQQGEFGELLMLPGPGGILIPEDEWMQQTENGCSNCTANIQQNDANEILWHGPAPLCVTCVSDNDDVRAMLGMKPGM